MLTHVLIGVLATIALGLLCARFLWGERYSTWRVWSSASPATSWPGPVPSDWPPSDKATTPDPSYTDQRRALDVSFGILDFQYLVRDGSDGYCYDVYAYGMPLPALRLDDARPFFVNGWREGFDNAATFPRSGYEVENPGWTDYPRYVLPLLPYWPGFLLDVAFWAWISALTCRLFAAARTTRRLSRGLCPNCRYPIGPVPTCSECGTAIPGGLCRPRSVPEGANTRAA